jgi:hypothetical protein
MPAAFALDIVAVGCQVSAVTGSVTSSDTQRLAAKQICSMARSRIPERV